MNSTFSSVGASGTQTKLVKLPSRGALLDTETADSLLAGAAPIEIPPAASEPGETACQLPRQRAWTALSPEAQSQREEMIAQNLPLVRYVSNTMARHVGQSVLLDFEDLVSYGNEGLIAAADTFDAGRGLKFSTWAVMHIRTTIQDALRTLDPMPRSLRARGKEIERLSAELAHAHGAWPELATIAEALGQPIESLRHTLQDLAQTAVSLEQSEGSHNGVATAGDDGGFSLLDLLADDDPETSPEETLDRSELSRLLAEAIAALPPREEVLIDAHYRDGQSMRTVSQMLGISESRVSQLHARAVRMLREYMLQALSFDMGTAAERDPLHVIALSATRSIRRRRPRVQAA